MSKGKSGFREREDSQAEMWQQADTDDQWEASNQLVLWWLAAHFTCSTDWSEATAA